MPLPFYAPAPKPFSTAKIEEAMFWAAWRFRFGSMCAADDDLAVAVQPPRNRMAEAASERAAA